MSPSLSTTSSVSSKLDLPPNLTGMTTRTLKAKHEAGDDPNQVADIQTGSVRWVQWNTRRFRSFNLFPHLSQL